MASTSDETSGLTNDLSKSSIVEQTANGDEVKVDKEKAEEFKEMGNKAFRGLSRILLRKVLVLENLS